MRLSDRINGSITSDFTKILNESYSYAELEDWIREASEMASMGDSHEEIWNYIVRETGDEDLANDALAAIDGGVFESEDPTKGEEALKTLEDQLERNWKLKTEVGIEEAEEVLTETTNKELRARHEAYRERQRQALRDAGDPNPESTAGIARRLPPEVWNELDIEGTILDCIEMTHSILTYAPDNNRTLEYVLDSRYIKKYIDKLGEDKVREIANQEVEEYKNATVNTNAYTDSEGVTYNSVTFKDE